MELKHNIMYTSALRLGLLIVPYGIETKIFESDGDEDYLLIVPYGIETRM